MKFIFPQNYNFKVKFLGLLDYPSIILNFVWWIIIYIFSSLFIYSLLFKLIFFIITCFPVFLLSLFGFHQENIIYVFNYVLMFYKNPKIYLYEK